MEYRTGNVIIAGVELDPAVYADTVGRFERPSNIVRHCMLAFASGDFGAADVLCHCRRLDELLGVTPAAGWSRFVDAVEARVLELGASRAGLRLLADLLEVPHV